ncbi:MAG: hypothetical protein HYZ53_30770 [Planctomycetes bacterium]|nr:hypothetical protein [Planctomycetota bacterium]
MQCARSARRTRKDRGGALLFVTILIVGILGLSAGMLARSLSEGRSVELSLLEASALACAEAGAHAALHSLSHGGTGVLGSSTAPSAYWAGSYYTEIYDATSPPDGSKAIVSRGSWGKSWRGVEMIVKQTLTPVSFNARAGITTKSDVQTLGNFTVDGRDWNDTGTALVDRGTFGISSMRSIAAGGASAVGGNGSPPTGAPTSGLEIEPNAAWPSGFPPGPDEAVGLPPDTLKAAAKASGTYCASAAEWIALVAANGGKTPSGKVIYLDFDGITPMEFGTPLNADPSILVMHNAKSSAYMKNLHGYFKGLLLVDDIDHGNAGTLILGAIMTFRPTTGGNAFGNGDADFKYSSAVLSRLPGTSSGDFSIVSWREFPAFLQGKPAWATGGASNGGF